MRYFNIKTGEYPRHLGDLQLIYGDIDESEIPADWVYVELEPMPEISENQKFEPDTPRLVDGVWMQGWIVSEMTKIERDAMNAIRAEKLEELTKNRPAIPTDLSISEE